MDQKAGLFVTLLILFGIPSLIYCQAHDKPCTSKEARKKACLNGGECFVIEIQTREVLCRCPRLWRGPRCLQFNEEYIFAASAFPLNSTATWAIIIAAIVVGVIIGVIVMYCSSKWYRRRRRARRPVTDKEDHNGHVVVYTEVQANSPENGVDV